MRVRVRVRVRARVRVFGVWQSFVPTKRKFRFLISPEIPQISLKLREFFLVRVIHISRFLRIAHILLTVLAHYPTTDHWKGHACVQFGLNVCISPQRAYCTAS